MSEITNQLLAEKYSAFIVALYERSKRSIHQDSCLKAYSRGFYVLFTLKFHPNSDLSLTQLANELHISKQQLTKLVNDLEEKQLIKRLQHPSNRRTTVIKLTGLGEKTLQNTMAQTIHDIMPIFDIFTSAEKEQLYNCMTIFEQLLLKADLHYIKKETLARED